MQEKVQKNTISPEEVAKMRKKLRTVDCRLIAEMLDGLYKEGTIYKMITGARRMKPIVFTAANKLIETIDKLKKQLK